MKRNENDDDGGDMKINGKMNVIYLWWRNVKNRTKKKLFCSKPTVTDEEAFGATATAGQHTYTKYVASER